jgi:hypothetical protein
VNDKQQEYMARIRQAAFDAVNQDDIRDIFKELVAKAKRGDMQAARMVFAYVLPPPVQVKVRALVRPRPGREGRHLANGKPMDVIEHRKG